MLTHIFRPDFEAGSGGGGGGGIYYKDAVTGAVNGITVPGLVIGGSVSGKAKSGKYAALNGGSGDQTATTMPRVESETSDLGDSKSDEEEEEEDEGSVSGPSTPRSSTMHLHLDDAAELGRSLLRATETHI